MIYLIDQNEEFNQSYSKEEIQKLIDENKIGLNTNIWTEQWNKWKLVEDTDFNLQKAINVRISKKRNEYEVNEESKKSILYGALWCIGGLVVTIGSYSSASDGGSYTIAWGAIIFGLIKFFKGLDNSY
jgi:hypothetical protein